MDDAGSVRGVERVGHLKGKVEHLSNLSTEEAVELGSKIGALVGLGIEGEAGMEAGAALGAEAAADGMHLFSDADAWDVLMEIPNDTAAALLLIEHHWAVPLRDAVRDAGGIVIGHRSLTAEELVAFGMDLGDELALEAELDAAEVAES